MKAVVRRLLWLIALVAVSVYPPLGPDPDPVPAPPPAADLAVAQAAPRTTDEMLESMAALVGLANDADYVAEWARKIDAGAPIDAFIDELVASRRFGAEIMPALVFGAFVNVRNYYALPSAFTLKRSPESVFYLREPCPPATAVAVHPWWDLASEVKVCADSYRPAKWTMSPSEHTYRSRMALACDSQVGSPELEASPLCGCGPNLIRCTRDEAQYDELNKSMMNEIKQTTAYVVDHDLPIASLFTGNSTFRDRNVELYYRRQKIGTLEIDDAARELEDLARWPEAGQWAPREEQRPGQHAGVLTSPQLLHWLPDRRQRQRGYYEVMWCAMKNSFGATTKKVLDLNSTGNLAFVHDSWERLAHTELCTNCHARLDYGFQFFLGYPDSRASTHYNPTLQVPGTGPLYGRDIKDPRGTGPLTPIGFAKLATAQPEFTGCMTNHFVAYVLGNRATDDDRRAIEAAVESTQRFKPAMKVALRRYAERWREDTRVTSSQAPGPMPVGVGGGGDTLPIGGELRARLDDLCSDCHHDGLAYSSDPDSGDLPVDFAGTTLPRPLLIGMADRVAFGMMPKDHPLSTPAREQLVTLLIETLWSDPQARAEAQGYYLGRARGLPAHQIDNMIYAIDHVAHAQSGIGWGALERGIWSDQSTTTPGLLAVAGLEALRACTQARNLQGDKLDDCLVRATSLQLVTPWTPAHAPLPTRNQAGK